MMKARMDKRRLERKLRSLQNLRTAFRMLPSHAAFRYRDELVGVVLNFQPIGRVSGNLARSPQVMPIPGGNSVEVRIDQAIAPYAPKVSAYSAARFGKPFMQIAYMNVIDEILTAIRAEFKRAIRLIDSGRLYEYENPFYN